MLKVILIYSCLHLGMLSACNASCLQVSHNANRVDTQTCDHAMLLRTAKALLTLGCSVCAAVPCGLPKQDLIQEAAEDCVYLRP